MTYQPLAEVRKVLRVKWYRSKIDHTTLRNLSKRSDLQGWFQAGGHLALWLLTGSLVYFFWSQAMWLGFFIGLFVHGTVASFFKGTANHELGHGTVFRTKWLNKFFLYLLSLISWWDHFDYASSHTYHHRYTLYPEGDRENLLPLEPKLGSLFVLQLFTINLLTQPGRTFSKGGLIAAVICTVRSAFGKEGPPDIPSQEWLASLHTDQPAEHKNSIWWSRILLLFHGTLLVVSLATGYWVFPLIITASAFIANWGSYAVSMPQHCGLKENDPDFRKCTRSITLNPLAEFLYWRMNWHIEHHTFAGVPCYNLKKLHYLVAEDMPEPRTLLGAWREMRETWQRQKTDPDHFFDTPLPPTAQYIPTETPDVLESSIGELAPKGLE
ncbi:MAG: fatty acid desaturase [Candidatus Poribacteria bacterium]|nr:fatty acid desaturase [Candidatus Poribacteria bacterium]